MGTNLSTHFIKISSLLLHLVVSATGLSFSQLYIEHTLCIYDLRLRLALRNRLFFSGFLVKLLYRYSISPLHVPCPDHRFPFYFNRPSNTIYGENNNLRFSSFRIFLQSPITRSPSGPNAFHCILLSCILKTRYKLKKKKLYSQCKMAA
jgi:hypothetical protein